MRAILCADSKTCFRVSQLQCGNTGEDSAVLDQSVDCQKLPIVYFFNRSRRPRLSRSARFENQGRTCKSAAVCALAAFPSDDRVETHGNMSTAVLCRNFSGEASRPRCRQTREVRWHRRSRPALEARQANTGYGRVEVSGWRLNDFGFGALPTEIETRVVRQLAVGNRGGTGRLHALRNRGGRSDFIFQ